MERRNITLEKKHLDILSPLLEKNEGNISASIREIIEFADMMIKSHGSLENAIDDAVSSEKIENQRVLVDKLVWQWLLGNSQGILPEKGIVKGLFEPVPYPYIDNLVEQVNDLCIRLGWRTKTRFEPSSTYILSGGSEGQRALILKLICLFIADYNIGIEHISNRYSETSISFIERNNASEAYRDCLVHLGDLGTTIQEIRTKQEFWKTLVGTHINTNYQMVTIHRKNYEKLMSGQATDDTDLFSVYTGLPRRDINLQALLPMIKSVFETSRIVDRIDIDQDQLTIFHSYSNKEVIESITETLVNILEMNGYHYEAVEVSSLIVLQHKREIEGRISELVDSLVSSRGGFDHELMAFLIFLDGIKDKKEICTTVEKLGIRMGEQIIKEYEREFDIGEWDLETFKTAFSDIDLKLARESDLELIDPNVMHYVVTKCQFVHPHGKFNIHLCNITHSLLKGATDYVFKGDAVIKSKKTIGRGDDLCEFYIVLPTKLTMPSSKSYDL